MATRVEEEYNNCIFALTLAQTGADEGMVNAEMYKALDSLISAARSEGVAGGTRDKGLQESNYRKVENLLSEANAKLATAKAEGAEEALARIREAARPLLVSRGGALEVVSIPASVLAPTKEGEP